MKETPFFKTVKTVKNVSNFHYIYWEINPFFSYCQNCQNHHIFIIYWEINSILIKTINIIKLCFHIFITCIGTFVFFNHSPPFFIYSKNSKMYEMLEKYNGIYIMVGIWKIPFFLIFFDFFG